MRNLAVLFCFLVLAWGGGGNNTLLATPSTMASPSGSVSAQQPGGCTPPPAPTWTCINGGWLPPMPPAPAPTLPAPTPPVQVISVGETVTGALSAATFDSKGFHPEVFEILYELTAPSDGFLTVQLNNDPAFGCVDWRFEDVGRSLLPTTEVIAGRTYRVVVFSTCWDVYPSFVLTTSISPEAPVPVIPCMTIQPAFDWVCINGGWVPPGHPLAQAGAPPPTPPAPALPVEAMNCLTGQPASTWVCVYGGWVPPDHPLATAAFTNPPSPPPVPTGACMTPDPFIGIPGLFGVCVSGGWVPISHPLAGGGG